MKYFILANGEQQGPFTIEELRDKRLSSETFVWAEGMPQWLPAWQVEELKDVLKTSPTPPPPPVVEQPAAKAGDDEATSPLTPGPVSEDSRRRRRGCGGKLWLLLIVLAALVALLVYTCPDKQQHKDVIRSEFNAAMNERFSQGDGLIDKGLNLVSKYFFNKVADVAIDEMLDVDNYFVASVGRINIEGKDRIVSVGVLRHIFTFDKKDLLQALDKMEQEAATSAANATLDEAATQVGSKVEDFVTTALGKIGAKLMQKGEKMMDEIINQIDSI